MKRLIITAVTGLLGATSLATHAGRDESQITASRRQHATVLEQRAAKQDTHRSIGQETRAVIVGRDRVPVRQAL